jgi:hypothetical protein
MTVFESLIFQDQDRALDDPVEIRSEAALKKLSKPEPKERAMTF